MQQFAELVNHRAHTLNIYYEKTYQTYLVLDIGSLVTYYQIDNWLKENVICGYRINIHRLYLSGGEWHFNEFGSDYAVVAFVDSKDAVFFSFTWSEYIVS